MISAIVFSRDRPAQLDLLLYSLHRYANRVFNPIYVLYYPSTDSFDKAYKIVEVEHQHAVFLRETDFHNQTRTLLGWQREFVTFFTDDDILMRPIPYFGGGSPEIFLEDPDVACFSLRLGKNTTTCYPLQREQDLPPGRQNDLAMWWEWVQADGDFGYPASLDGHVFRLDEFQALIDGDEFANPNELEQTAAIKAHLTLPPVMACYRHSVVCGNPVNRVNETHPNRHGKQPQFGVDSLNEQFLEGRRLQIPDVTPDGAHMEIDLSFIGGDE